MSDTIGVGIIGASPQRSWAVVAHLPAIAAVAGLEVVAVSTTRISTAQQTAEQFGIAAVHDNHLGLIHDPKVELVVVAVKVPNHLELVTAAIEAGKHVYCEWPLGNGLQEAQHLYDLANKAGVRHFIGLQSRFSPQISHLKTLISQGYIGEIMSASLVAPAGAWGQYIDTPNLYLLDQANGATMLTIPGGHLLDAYRFACGDVVGIRSAVAAMRKSAQVIDTGETVSMNVDDQLAFIGHLTNGGVFSMHLHGGQGGGGLRWEVNGRDGDLLLTASGAHVGMLDVSLSYAKTGEPLAALDTPDAALSDCSERPDGPARNVSRLYEAVAADLRDGANRAPTFATAVELHRLLEEVETGSS